MVRLTPATELPSSVSQNGIFAMHRAQARLALLKAANTLAPLSGSEPLRDTVAVSRHKELPSPVIAQEIAATALVAEAVVALTEQVADLREQVAVLRAAKEGN
jgi:hypothetical protein